MLPDLKRIIESLCSYKVDFIIVGGMAGVAQGVPITTFDLDICYRRSSENIKRLVEALSGFNPKLRNVSGKLPFIFDEIKIRQGCNFKLSTDVGDLDLFGELQRGCGYEKLIKKAIKLEIFDHEVYVMHISDLIVAKEKLSRPKDKAALEILKETFRILKKREENNYSEQTK